MAEAPTAPDNEIIKAPAKYSANGLRNLIDRTRQRIKTGEGKKDQSVRESILRTSNQISKEELTYQTKNAEAAEQQAKEAVQKALEAENKTMYDEKTGLHNDRWIKERVENAIREAQRTGKNFFVTFMDIDDYKIVNSRFDHSGGDKVLKLFSEMQTRPGEDVARYGGDEFVQVLNEDIQEDEAVGVASRNSQGFSENSRGLISQMHVFDSETPQLDEVTLSVGLVQYRPGMTFDDLKAESSQMLLNSKNLGRDRISLKNSAGEVKVFDRLGNQIPIPAGEPVTVS